ncbi:hypothetical protein RSAG8_11934, partial [Rhizoctonia solani AG-8 WAC10335]
MFVTTPKPEACKAHEHRRRQSADASNMGLLSQLSRVFKFLWGLFLAMLKGAFAILRIPVTPRSKSQPTILPHYIPPLSRVDVSMELTGAAPTTVSSAQSPSPSNHTIQTPAQAVLPTNPDLPAPQKSSPTTAQFLATLTDLEAQMSNHQFYDLERELEDMDSHMARMNENFPWIPRQTAVSSPPSPPETPIPLLLPQPPPPARRDRKTIQILPMICEVSENSPNLIHTPPFEPGWSVVTFRPLWGPRTQVRTAY